MIRASTLQLEPREKRVVIGGAVIVTVLLAFLLWPSGTDQSAVELVPADQRPAPAAPQPIPVVQAGPPVAPPAAMPAAPAALTEGLVLHGVMAGGAIIGFPNGTQRYVPIGREVMPGLRLQGVQLHHAILASGSVNYRLGFGGSAVALTPAPQVVASAPASPPAPAAPGAPVTAFTPAPPQQQAAQRAETARYRLGLAPRQVNGQVSGYTLRPGISLPPLEQAGLRPGDTILRFNGAQFGPQHLEELARGGRGELEVERGGQRLRIVVQNRQ